MQSISSTLIQNASDVPFIFFRVIVSWSYTAVPALLLLQTISNIFVTCSFTVSRTAARSFVWTAGCYSSGHLHKPFPFDSLDQNCLTLEGEFMVHNHVNVKNTRHASCFSWADASCLNTTVQKWKQWPVYFTLCNFFIYIFLQGLTEFSICTLAGMQHSNIVKVLFVTKNKRIIINIQDLNIDQSNGDNHVGHNGAALLLSA